MEDQRDLMFRTIGEPYTCEVVIVETSVLKQALEALQFYANPDNYTYQEKLRSGSGKNWLMAQEGVEGRAVEALKLITKVSP